jgi:hypothetical protein
MLMDDDASRFVGISHVRSMVHCMYLHLGDSLIFVGGVHAKTTLTGVTVGVDVSASEKIWKTFQSLGDIAFAYSYSNVLIEIQVTNTILMYINMNRQFSMLM